MPKKKSLVSFENLKNVIAHLENGEIIDHDVFTISKLFNVIDETEDFDLKNTYKHIAVYIAFLIKKHNEREKFLNELSTHKEAQNQTYTTLQEYISDRRRSIENRNHIIRRTQRFIKSLDDKRDEKEKMQLKNLIKDSIEINLYQKRAPAHPVGDLRIIIPSMKYKRPEKDEHESPEQRKRKKRRIIDKNLELTDPQLLFDSALKQMNDREALEKVLREKEEKKRAEDEELEKELWELFSPEP